MLPTGILVCCTGPFWSSSLCLFGFCLPSLRCLISALTQGGGGDLLFGFASSVQSCYGEGGALQTDIAVCGEHSPCSGHTGFTPAHGCLLSPSTLLRLPAALYGAGPALPAVPVLGSSTKARIRLRLRFMPSPAWAAQAARAWRAHSPGVRPFPSAAPASVSVPAACVCSQELASSRDPPGSGCRPSRISGSLWIETGGLFAVWDGVASLGPSLPLSPPPCLLPPVGMGRSAAG